MINPNVLNLAREWYSYSLPRKIDTQFAEFAAKSATLANQVSRGILRIDASAPTAYIDPMGITYLPGKYFDPKYFIEELKVAPEDATATAITLINGSTVHEALHRLWTSPNLLITRTFDQYLSEAFGSPSEESNWLSERFTKKQIEKACEQFDRKVRYANYRRETFKASNLAKALCVLDQITVHCIQIVEDVYNEYRCSLEFVALSEFVVAKNQILFTEDSLNEYAEKLLTEPNVEHILNMLTHTKNPHLRQSEVYSHELMVDAFHLLMKACNPDLTQVERTNLAVQISMVLQQNDEIDCSSEGEGEGEGGGESFDITIDPDGDPTGNVDSAEQDGSQVMKAFEAAVKNGELKAVKIDDDKGILPQYEYDLSRIAPVAVIDVINGESRFGKPIEYDTRFLNFSKMLTLAYEQKHVYGAPRERGPEISKKYLNRIGFDSRIFTRKDTIGLAKGRPEVIILCDWSGSMAGRSSYDGQNRQTLAVACLRAAYGAHVSLNQAGIANAIYAHTTGTDEDDDAPVLYAISAYNMPFTGHPSRIMTTRSVHERFQKAATFSNSENYDGFAVRKASKFFSQSPTDKLLIVLSDGQPSATYYNNEYAIEHTSGIVKILRRDGIAVFSMSLVSDVVSINDHIYGKDFNIRAYGDNMNRQMEMALRKAMLS